MAFLIEYCVGIIVILTVLSDIFRTVLLPRPTHRALRLGPVLGRTLAPLWRRMAGRLRSPTARQTLRASLGPLLLVLSILIWVAALVLGYGLMLHARAFDMQPPPDLATSLYYAGSAFMTIGFTDLTIQGPSRVTVVLAGMTGLAGVTILATFILSVQSALQAREVPVIQLAAITKCPPSGLVLLTCVGRNDSHGRLADIFRTWSQWAATVLHDHRANPVLMNFRSADERCEWLAALGAILDAACLVIALVDRDGIEDGSALAREFLLVGSHAVTNLATIFRLEGGAEPSGTSPDPCGPEEVAALRSALDASGYRLRPEDDSGAKLRELRGGYLSDLLALARQFDIAVDPRLHGPQAARVST
jgi:hypothetical protein